jgi:hypothetical protein
MLLKPSQISLLAIDSVSDESVNSDNEIVKEDEDCEELEAVKPSL